MIKKILLFLLKIIEHYQVLGLAGIRLLIIRVIKPRDLIRIKPKGYNSPFYLRANTSDITVFYQI